MDDKPQTSPTPGPPPMSDEPAPPNYDELEDTTESIAAREAAGPTADGRIAVNIDSKLAQALAKFVEFSDIHFEPPPRYDEEPAWTLPLNIVVQVVGSRGDVQPFVALGNELQKSGHRVRIATHGVFEDFVRNAGLEFFPIGGDPAELMAYVVKNPGLIPNMKTLRSGEITRKRKMIGEMLRGCWNSCIEPDPQSNAPFVANAIIANPVSFAHLHCAQALGIPLHLLFTMPWTPTRSFPHPLANIQNTSTDPKIANYLSYCLVQILTWQGLADVINSFRKTLDLDPLPVTEAPFILETLRIPYTYCWSPALVEKPQDWPNHIDVCGFIFRNLPDYHPPDDLIQFLQAGPKPIYVGFGSIVVDEPEKLLGIVLSAVKRAGVRAIISRGWSDLNSQDVPDGVFFIGDCPHEWLFQQVSAVVHHGGAGTTAAGLLNACPTTIIPFFGDQPFWGERIAACGAGPAPLPHRSLTASALAEAIDLCLTPDASQAALNIAEQMRLENGAAAAAASFHRHLSTRALGCDLVPTLPAAYDVNIKFGKSIKISSAVADILVQKGRLKESDLKSYQPKQIDIVNRRWDPFSSLTSSALGMSYDIVTALNDIWYVPHKMRQRAKKASLRKSLTNSSIDDDPGEGSSKDASSISTARMVGASAMSIPKMTGVLAKGGFIDAPLAVAEGFRNVPKLYGEHVPNHIPVTGIKTGAIVGAKEFAKGIGTGTTDLFVQPYKGAKENGIAGFAAGMGKGVIGSLTKLSTAAMSIYAYPAQGIWMSIRNATHARTRKTVEGARRINDRHHARNNLIDERKVLEAFDALTQKKKKNKQK